MAMQKAMGQEVKHDEQQDAQAVQNARDAPCAASSAGSRGGVTEYGVPAARVAGTQLATRVEHERAFAGRGNNDYRSNSSNGAGLTAEHMAQGNALPQRLAAQLPEHDTLASQNGASRSQHRNNGTGLNGATLRPQADPLGGGWAEAVQGDEASVSTTAANATAPPPPAAGEVAVSADDDRPAASAGHVHAPDPGADASADTNGARTMGAPQAAGPVSLEMQVLTMALSAKAAGVRRVLLEADTKVCLRLSSYSFVSGVACVTSRPNVVQLGPPMGHCLLCCMSIECFAGRCGSNS
jgi:hypothetical protein